MALDVNGSDPSMTLLSRLFCPEAEVPTEFYDDFQRERMLYERSFLEHEPVDHVLGSYDAFVLSP